MPDRIHIARRIRQASQMGLVISYSAAAILAVSLVSVVILYPSYCENPLIVESRGANVSGFSRWRLGD
ncbi:MAG: hypothetical protein JW941_06585, partial [Candidatus Coatesbacteria bacterium]|nr:hypothetical protein [Candidatus Coatesbacteria bacterium]